MVLVKLYADQNTLTLNRGEKLVSLPPLPPGSPFSLVVVFSVWVTTEGCQAGMPTSGVG